MVQVLYTINLKGGVVELLATPALFAIAKRKGMTITVQTDDASDVYSAYTKLIYLAALNAWDVRRYDNPGMGDFPYSLMDFVEWAGTHPQEFVIAMKFAIRALTGKEMEEYATGQAEGSENANKDGNKEDEEVKKKPRSGLITRLLRRS